MIKVPFSPPDITDAEINEVVEVLRSDWIPSVCDYRRTALWLRRQLKKLRDGKLSSRQISQLRLVGVQI